MLSSPDGSTGPPAATPIPQPLPARQPWRRQSCVHQGDAHQHCPRPRSSSIWSAMVRAAWAVAPLSSGSVSCSADEPDAALPPDDGSQWGRASGSELKGFALSRPELAIQPLGQHIDPDKHRQIGDPHVREIELCVVDQHKPAVADRAIDQGPAQWSGDPVQASSAWCSYSG